MKDRKFILIVFVLVLIVFISFSLGQPKKLQVSKNGRFLVHGDGTPFFYLGDTAWELFHRLNREEAERYLSDRARKGFTVIQAVALAELNGLNDPNPYGHRPLRDNNPASPWTVDGPANDYWDHVDWIVEKANSLGLVVAMLPTWGDKWNLKWGVGPEVFTPENAAIYGKWLGQRYRDRSIIWVVGGDRPVETEAHREIVAAMAKALREGDRGAHLITFHPSGGNGSAQYFHDQEWLDFNMRQNGHEVNFARYASTRMDYDRSPVKPIMDGEPVYEDHPVSFNAKELGHTISADVRRPLYWDLFTGAHGHTYGHHSIWQMWQAEREPINGPLMPWYEAIYQPGSGQMQHGKHLIQSRPFLERIPDDSVIVEDQVPTSVPGSGRYRLVATRDIQGTYAMVYSPSGRPFSVHMNKIANPQVKAWWFNPRNGQATEIGLFSNTGIRKFIPPSPGEFLDWVLVLDDASKKYPPPGSRW
jgi:hypothetical protein